MTPSRPTRFFGAAVLSAALIALPPPTTATAAPSAEPAAAGCDGPAYETFGEASTTGAIVGAVTLDDHAYVVTRGLRPPLLAEIDLTTNKVVREFRLPEAPGTTQPEGAWATAVSGGKIYIGTYPVPDLYQFDPATGEVTWLHSFGDPGGFVWSLDAAPDGTLYAGTSLDGKVWEYKPDTGEVRDFGVLVPGEHYVRTVAADDEYVYAGLLDKAKLMAIDRSDGTVRELASGSGGFGTVAEHGDRVLTGNGSKLLDMNKDGGDLRTVDLNEQSLDSFAFAPDGTAYLSTRPNGKIYRYRTDDGSLTEVGAPIPGDETRRLVLRGDTLLGFSGSGSMWALDLATGEAEVTDLIDAGLTTGPERPQSMLLGSRGGLYVGGNFSITVHNVHSGEQRRIWVAGEPKAMVRRGDKIYAALYPSGQIIELDQRTDAVRSLGPLGHDQKRPWDIEYDPVTDKLLVASSPIGANLKGALSIVDPDSGEKQVYQDVIPDQGLMSLSLDSKAGIVYLGGDVLGGGGTPPVKTAASVAAFDLDSRTVRWQVDPVAGYRTLQDIKIHGGVLYGVYKRNASWFAMDAATQKITAQGPLAGYGEITVHRGQVFTSTYREGGNVHLLSEDGRKLATGLGDEWFTNPQLHFVPGTWDAWAIIGRDLARIRLDPDCPMVIIE